MILKKMTVCCLASLLVLGMNAGTLSLAKGFASVQQQETGSNWQLLETKNGVSCYWRIEKMGTGNGVYLRFVNASGANAIVSWNVAFSEKEATRSGKLPLSAGQDVNSTSQPAGSDLLAVRIPSGTPVISFTVN